MIYEFLLVILGYVLGQIGPLIIWYKEYSKNKKHFSYFLKVINKPSHEIFSIIPAKELKELWQEAKVIEECEYNIEKTIKIASQHPRVKLINKIIIQNENRTTTNPRP